MAVRAFITGLAGTTVTPAERTLLREREPWGFILFKRNIGDRDQVLALTRAFRECVGRADAPVLIDQEGGRVQRMAPPHWRSYPSAAAIENGLEPSKAEAAASLRERSQANRHIWIAIGQVTAPV